MNIYLQDLLQSIHLDLNSSPLKWKLQWATIQSYPKPENISSIATESAPPLTVKRNLELIPSESLSISLFTSLIFIKIFNLLLKIKAFYILNNSFIALAFNIHSLYSFSGMLCIVMAPPKVHDK